MGVHDFTKIFEASERETTLAKLEKLNFAVDAFPELFRGTAMQYAAKLTNPRGEPTLHLTVALANICSRYATGARDIWCFDSRDPRSSGDAKMKTLLTRADIRRQNLEDIATQTAEIARLERLASSVTRAELLAVDPTFDTSLQVRREELAMMQARNPDKFHFSRMVRDVQFILEKLGIAYAIAPPGCDAEKLAAQLVREELVDGVITVDTDVLVYGAARQVKKIAGKSGRYDVYVLADILTKYDITREQLAQIASVMGCDFCEKTAGVGAKTVIKRVKSGTITYTEKQLAAQKIFLDDTPVDYELVMPRATPESIAELRAWLIDVQGFGSAGVDKKLSLFK